MSKQITIAGIKPIQFTISIGDDEGVSLSVRFARLDSNGESIEGFMGVLSTELEGGMKQKALNFVKNSVKQWVMEQEGITNG